MELTLSSGLSSGQHVWIMPAAIVLWSAENDKTMLLMNNGHKILVVESPERIFELICDTASKMSSIAAIASYEATMRHAQESGDL